MEFLCFITKENKFAINILHLYKIIDNFELTYYINEDQRAIYLINYLNKLIPIFEINNDLNYKSDLILIIDNTNGVFGIFIDEVKEIVRDELPSGYKLVSIEDLERFCLHENKKESNDIELF